MVIGIADVVKETTSTAGVGDLTLDGAASLARSFNAAGLNGKVVPFRIVDPVTNDWEINTGLFTSPSTLARSATPLSSTNGGAKINLAGNASTYVFVDVPADWFYLPGNFTLGSVLFAGTNGIITEGNIAWDQTTSTLMVAGAVDPGLMIAEGGSTTHYLEIINWNTVYSQIRHISMTGAAHLQFDAIATDLAGNQTISFHDNALASTGATLVEFHTKASTTRNAIIGCDGVTHTFFCGDFGKFGIGFNTTPDSKLHVLEASAGAIVAQTDTVVTIENSTHAYISILTPNTATAGLIVGDVNDNDVGSFLYSHSTNTWTLVANATQMMVSNTTGTIIGTGITTPDSKLHVHAGSAGVLSAAGNTVLTIENSFHANIAILTPNTSIGGIQWGDPEDNAAASFSFTHSTNLFAFSIAATAVIYIGGTGIGVGTAGAPTARIHSQVPVTGAIPTLKLHQGDLSEQFIDFISTSAASVTNPISTWKSGGAIQGFTRQTINGAEFWMPYYSAPSSANPNFAEVSITGAITLTATAFGKMHAISGTTANYTITLPAVSGNTGQLLNFRVVSTGTRLYTLDGNGTEQIGGSQTLILWANETIQLYCNGTGWDIVGGRCIPMSCIMKRTTAQSIGTGWTQVLIPTVVMDNTSSLATPMGDTANGQVRIIRPGRYGIQGFGTLEGLTAGVETTCAVVKNSATPNDDPNSFNRFNAPASGNYAASAFAYFDCALNDWLGVSLLHQQGAARNTRTTSSVQPCLSCVETPSW